MECYVLILATAAAACGSASIGASLLSRILEAIDDRPAQADIGHPLSFLRSARETTTTWWWLPLGAIGASVPSGIASNYIFAALTDSSIAETPRRDEYISSASNAAMIAILVVIVAGGYGIHRLGRNEWDLLTRREDLLTEIRLRSPLPALEWLAEAQQRAEKIRQRQWGGKREARRIVAAERYGPLWPTLGRQISASGKRAAIREVLIQHPPARVALLVRTLIAFRQWPHLIAQLLTLVGITVLLALSLTQGSIKPVGIMLLYGIAISILSWYTAILLVNRELRRARRLILQDAEIDSLLVKAHKDLARRRRQSLKRRKRHSPRRGKRDAPAPEQYRGLLIETSACWPRLHHGRFHRS